MGMSLSWEKVEDKLRAILEDRLVPSQAKEACAWSSLALGVHRNFLEVSAAYKSVYTVRNLEDGRIGRTRNLSPYPDKNYAGRICLM